MPISSNLLELVSVDQEFADVSDKPHKILSNINLELKQNEILAIVGKSGSGKSTLLRIIAGLAMPSSGKINFLKLPNRKLSIGMVFQTFALFPWLNVLENVELGIESYALVNNKKIDYALECINLIGLKGFESAMPRELSSSMKQRVCFARSLAMDPDILLLDEPFSALDTLTATTLKNDFLKLLNDKKTAIKSVVIATHSIEEAVSIAERVIILGNSPASIIEQVKITTQKPRDLRSGELEKIIDRIYYCMTQVENVSLPNRRNIKTKESEINQKVQLVLPSEIFALAGLLNSKEYKGKAEIADLMHILRMKMQRILYIAQTLSLFKFAVIEDANVKLTKLGKLFAESDLQGRKILFTKQLSANVPLSNYIIKVIKDRPEQTVPKKRFITHLEDYMTKEEAKTTLNAVIAWGRYAEIFSYEDNMQIFTLNKGE